MSQGFTKGTPIDTDPTLSLNSDIVVPSQAAVVTYVASQVGGKQDPITLTTAGASGSSTFILNTLNVPTYTITGLGGVPTSRTITIDGVTQDLSADRSFSTVGSRSSALVATPAGPVGINVTTYSGLSSVSNSTENVRVSAFGVATTASAITVITNNAQTATGSLVFTLRSNTADTSLSLTIAAGSAAGTFTATGSVSVAASDRIAIKIQNNSTTVGSATIITITTIWTI